MIDNQIERFIRGSLGLLKPVPRLSLPVGVEKEFRLPERPSAHRAVQVLAKSMGMARRPARLRGALISAIASRPNKRCPHYLVDRGNGFRRRHSATARPFATLNIPARTVRSTRQAGFPMAAEAAQASPGQAGKPCRLTGPSGKYSTSSARPGAGRKVGQKGPPLSCQQGKGAPVIPALSWRVEPLSKICEGAPRP